MLQKKRLTPHQALLNAKQYCAYQERSHVEVKEKLFSFGLSSPDAETILSQLIEEDYLNEERFAQAFARGRFRMKQWGRVKIRYELKQKNVSEYCIKKALKEIENGDYTSVLLKLTKEKLKTLKSEKNIQIKKSKLVNYLLQKGYERDLILSSVHEQLSE